MVGFKDKISSLFITNNKLLSHKKVSENKDLCGVVMTIEDNKRLEFNQYWKSDKITSIIYADQKNYPQQK